VIGKVIRGRNVRRLLYYLYLRHEALLTEWGWKTLVAGSSQRPGVKLRAA
jgi:hypothetical protein